MARVMIPVQPRRYNFNPKGSATAVVTMRGHNPFERTTSREALQPYMLRSRPGGLAGLGDDAPGTGAMLGPPSPTPAATDSGSTPIDWTKIAQLTAAAVQPLATAEASKLLTKATASTLPGQTAPKPLAVGAQPIVAKPASKLPWILGGVGAVAAIGILFLVLRKKH